ncbi:hypothetical protein O0L34_g9578 [Tuta absoluta]|nr:hypothetical protein O0L34_g9578 [Tuta absoluta]
MTMFLTYRRSLVNNIVQKLVGKNDRHFSIYFKTKPICKPNLNPCCSVLFSNDWKVNINTFVGSRYFTHEPATIISSDVGDSPDNKAVFNEPAANDLVMHLEDFSREGLTPFAIMPDIDSPYDEFNLGEDDEEDSYESDEEDDIDIAEP